MIQIINMSRGYQTPADRKRAISQLRKRGLNYFVCYQDTASPFALMYAIAEWVTQERGPNGVYIDW